MTDSTKDQSFVTRASICDLKTSDKARFRVVITMGS